MENLNDKIKQFLAIGDGYGKGYGYGASSGFGYGYGDAEGSGYGRGSGAGSGYVVGFGNSKGYSNGFGNSDGSGNGYGHSNGSGSGYGDDDGNGIKEIRGRKVYMVDNTPTLITSVRDNIAQGFILQSDLQLEHCFIVKENNMFAHGNTLRDAFMSLQEKLYDDSTKEERIEAFKQKFPSYDTKYDNRDLFAYHHVLTGSCRMGRESFVADKGLSLDGKTTVREFVQITKEAYGGSIIKLLPQVYGITE